MKKMKQKYLALLLGLSMFSSHLMVFAMDGPNEEDYGNQPEPTFKVEEQVSKTEEVINPIVHNRSLELNHLLFEEDFTHSEGTFLSNDRWDVRNVVGKGEFLIKNNALKVVGEGNNVIYSKREIALPEPSLSLNSSTYSVEVTMTLGEGHINGSYFVGFAVNPVTKERYELEYHKEGILRLVRINGTTQTNVKSVNYRFEKGKNYRLKIIVSGESIQVFVDGIGVLVHSDRTPATLGRGISIRGQYPGQDMTFDTLEIKVDKKDEVSEVISVVESDVSTDGIVGDTTGGTLVLSKHKQSGEEVLLKPLIKNNYRLDEIKPFSFIGDNGEEVIIEVEDGKFIMPNHSVKVIAHFVSESMQEAVNYYVDADNGNDNNEGTSQEAPIKSLEKVNEIVLRPGDQLLFKAGSNFTAEGEYAAGKYLFTPKGSGKEGRPITIGMYGEGEKPRFNGAGRVETVVYLDNQEYITIENLEITNEDNELPHSYELNQNTNTTKILRGVHVNAKDYGVVHEITLKDLYIHNINGKLNSKWNGGIFFDAGGTIENEMATGKPQLIGVPTKYDGILIENNTFEKVDRSGIKLVGSKWCNRSITNDPNVPINWYPSTNVIVRGNYMDDIGGDGITVRDTDGALVEYNLVRESNKQEKITGYNVAIWPFQADNTVIQFNEAYLTYGLKDGQGFDADHLCKNSVIQYNYSHDNIGGFMLVMGWYQMYENVDGNVVATNQTNTGVTIRYNISQNDLDHTFEITRGIPNGLSIYNNTIYLDKKLDVSIFDLAAFGNSQSNSYEDFYVFNNIFYYTGDASSAIFYGRGENAINHLKEYGYFTNNAYYGIAPPIEEKNPIIMIQEENDLMAAGTGPGVDTGIKLPITGKYLTNQLDGFKLNDHSKLIDTGITLGEIYNQVDDKDKLLGTQSNPFKEIEGVDYTKDFFGNKFNQAGLRPDIGAYERITVDQNSGIAINGDDEVVSGEILELEIGLVGEPKSVYAQDYLLKYDETLFELIGVEGIEKEDFTSYKQGAGEVRIIVATEGGVKNGKNNVKIKLKALGEVPVDTRVTIDNTQIGMIKEGISEVGEVVGTQKLITIIEGDIGGEFGNSDINQDGKVDVADLALVSYYYLRTSNDDMEWEQAKKADLNKDGIIDIKDLAEVANNILGEN